MKSIIHYIRKHKLLLVVLILAFFAQMLTIMPSGSYYCHQDKCGLFFWGAHGHDAIWHIAVIQNSFKQIPFSLPIFAGVTLQGYNYLLDLVLYVLSFLSIPPLFSYFKLIPLIWFTLITFSAIRFAKKHNNSPIFLITLLFFIFFGGSFSYFITLIRNGSIWDSSGLLAMQAGLSLVNPQFALSLVVIFELLTGFYEKKYRERTALLIIIAFGLKFYAGIIALILAASFLTTDILKNKNRIYSATSLILLIAASVMSVFIFYDPLAATKNGANLILSPMSTVHPIIEDPNLLYMKDKVNARYFLEEAMKQTGRISPRYLGIEMMTLGLFVLFNLGTRIIAIPYFIAKTIQRKINPIEISMGIGVMSAFLLTVLFIQKGIWWNTIQFTYYALFLSGIFAAKSLAAILSRRKILNIAISFAIIILTLPTSIDIVRGFSAYPSPAYLPTEEIEALDFLKRKPEGVVYSTTFNKPPKTDKYAPFPLYQYDDTAYVTAFSGKQSYMANKTQLELLNVEYKNRKDLLQSGDCSILEKIRYIYYLRNTEDKIIAECKNNLLKIFENKSVIVFKVLTYSTIK